MDRSEIAQALLEADERVERLRPAILANANAPLLEGKWSVRDCLSHVASRAYVTAIVARMEQRLAQAAAGQTPTMNVDDINRGQVEERAGHTVEALLDEVVANHAKAAEELSDLSDERLEQRVPNFRGPGDSSMAEVVLRNVHGHESGHLDAIEQAIATASG
jgi:hypothetical protein